MNKVGQKAKKLRLALHFELLSDIFFSGCSCVYCIIPFQPYINYLWIFLWLNCLGTMTCWVEQRLKTQTWPSVTSLQVQRVWFITSGCEKQSIAFLAFLIRNKKNHCTQITYILRYAVKALSLVRLNFLPSGTRRLRYTYMKLFSFLRDSNILSLLSAMCVGDWKIISCFFMDWCHISSSLFWLIILVFQLVSSHSV